MEANTETIPTASMYKLLSGAIVPRPIAWVSTVDGAGNANLAPFSYFNAVCSNPPTVLFCSSVRGVDGQPKDTLKNIRETGEFVINIVTEDLAEAMNLTATELPADVDEFDFAGLDAVPAAVVRPPRVAASPIHFECRMTQIVDINDQPGGGSIVIGRVLHVHVEDAVLIGEDKINIAALKPIGRLAGPSYAYINEMFDMVRKPSQIKPGSE